MNTKRCEQCDIPLAGLRISSSARFCLTCANERGRRCTQRSAANHQQQYKNVAKAHDVVACAVRRGKLPKLDGTIACVDCGKPARNYDHRDYAKPLDVVPVCIPCNIRRGTGINRTSDFEHILLRAWLGPMTFVDRPYPEKKPRHCKQCGTDITHRFGSSRFCFPCRGIRDRISKANRQPDPLLYIFYRVLAGPIATK